MSSGMAGDHSFPALSISPALTIVALNLRRPTCPGLPRLGRLREMVSRRGLVRRIGRRSDPCRSECQHGWGKKSESRQRSLHARGAKASMAVKDISSPD